VESIPSKEKIMSTETATSFDLDAFARCLETWDTEGLLDLYADDVELTQIDRDNPPSAPRVSRGKDILRGMFEYPAAAGVKATMENLVTGPDRAAATITCTFPDGRTMVANTILDIRDGRIVRQHEVVAGDRS
jgi:ketosteroid isomerase-like protein